MAHELIGFRDVYDEKTTSHDGIAVLPLTFKILNMVIRVSRLCQVQKRGNQS